MKTSKIKSFVFGLAFLGSFFFVNSGAKAQGLEGFDCKVELITCNYLTGSTRQVCHQNGTGVSCQCGESTVCP